MGKKHGPPTSGAIRRLTRGEKKAINAKGQFGVCQAASIPPDILLFRLTTGGQWQLDTIYRDQELAALKAYWKPSTGGNPT